MRCLRLPLAFDPDRLRRDLSRVAPSEWIPHMQRNHYRGEWSGAPLRAIDGSAENLVPEAHAGAAFRDTALLGRCPYFAAVLAEFRCPVQAARLLRLHAGSHIAEHVDHALDFDDGEARLHIPIETSADVEFILDGARLVMAPGECWYTNVNLPHSVENAGTAPRIHLVIDCLVDAWLRELFARTPRPPCDHYAARFATAAAPAFGSLLEIVTSAAPPDMRLLVERNTLVLTRRTRPAWQFRLHLPSTADPAEAWTLRLESSPDPARQHRPDYERLTARIAAGLPGATVTLEGLV